MVFDPKTEPCYVCGREIDECICGMAPDFPEDLDPDNDEDYGWPSEEDPDGLLAGDIENLLKENDNANDG